MEDEGLIFESRAGERSAIIFPDRIERLNTSSFAPWKKLAQAFLPEGFPASVTSDYLAFQTWDTLQGVSTYIRSMLSTQALLSGIGVGAASATAIGATFQWFVRDLTGMVGGILFTLFQGSNLDNRAKQWRLAADLMNDIGMLMDLVSPLFPKAFILLLCLGSAARAVTGVASGATRAALTQHFARKQNAADISAKEGSQETAATLVGMTCGMFLARFTADNIQAMWACFLVLTAFHMYANYKAVRSLCLSSLNAERLRITLTKFIHEHKVPSPREAAAEEAVLPQVFPGRSEIIFGARLSSLWLHGSEECSYKADLYMLVCKNNSVHVVLHSMVASQDFLRAYSHAIVFQHFLESNSNEEAAKNLSSSWMESRFQEFLSLLQESGWRVDQVLISALEWRADWTHKKLK